MFLGKWGGDGAKEFQLANDKVSGQQQSLNHKKKFLMGRQRDELSPIFLAFLRFLFGIFLKPVA